MNRMTRIFTRLRKLIGNECDRESYRYLYLDRRALKDHYRAMTGLTRAPVKVTSSAKAGGGLSLPVLNLGASGAASVEFEAGEEHLLEALEPELREKYPVVSNEEGVRSSLRSFAWFRGLLTWMQIGPTKLGNQEVEEARLFYVLESNQTTFCLGCRAEHFSPFYPFLVETPFLYKFSPLRIEVFAYNSGVLTQGGRHVHENAGRSLLLVPTVIILEEDGSKDDIVRQLRELNGGKLSRPLASVGE